MHRAEVDQILIQNLKLIVKSACQGPVAGDVNRHDIVQGHEAKYLEDWLLDQKAIGNEDESSQNEHKMI